MATQGPAEQPFGSISPAETWRMEQFCQAYVQAVASAAGCHILTWHVDDDHVDITLARKAELAAVRGARLDVQLKATKVRCRRRTHVSYRLDVPTYDALRPRNVMVPRILVVLLLRDRVEDWIHHTEARLALRRCAYWLTLRDAPSTKNHSVKTVRLPRAQVFDARALDQIFCRMEAGGLP